MSQPPASPSSAPYAAMHSWERGTRFLGTRHAILGGAMAWLSEHNLVSAISEAGGFGVLASGNMPAERLRQEIQATRTRTSRPFGVNLITLNPELPKLVQVVIDEKVSHCVLAGGLPDQPTIDTLKTANIKVILFAPSLALAKRLIKRGADALIIEGHEAGGHVGPVATTVLMQEILPHLTEVPVFAAGGIANGAMVASMVAMGAAGCQLGTRFVVSNECIAHANFKNAFLRAQSRDAQVTAQFDPVLPVIPVRALVNKGTQTFNALQLQLIQEVKAGTKDRKTAQLELEHFWVGALKRAAIDGDIENGSIMAGQSVGLVNTVQSVAEIIAELTARLSLTAN
ncbi:MAG: nitronate monooxygenase [Magnetococcales bacterium]|nr:nitronate monooxygenase [Magnetococcales bacterium]